MKKFLVLIVSFLSFSLPSYSFLENESEIAGKIFMEAEFLDGDILKVSVFGDEIVPPVLGVSFHLNYSLENLSFLKYEPGEFLERGGDPFYLVKNHDKTGDIVFGETLRRGDDYPVGNGLISNFYFQILDDGEFEFSFSNGVLSGLDEVRQDIDAILWEDLATSRGDDQAFSSEVLNSSIFGINSNFDYSRFIPVVLLVVAFSAAFFIIRVFRKQEKKRHG